MDSGKKNSIKIVTKNRKAFHDYNILETIEAGMVLTGTEVKSLRAGRCNLKDSYARIKNGEVWLIGMHISPTRMKSGGCGARCRKKELP